MSDLIAQAYVVGFFTIPLLFALTAVAYAAIRSIKRWWALRNRATVTMRCWDCDWEFDDYSAGICRKMIRSHRVSGRCPGGADDE